MIQSSMPNIIYGLLIPLPHLSFKFYDTIL